MLKASAAVTVQISTMLSLPRHQSRAVAPMSSSPASGSDMECPKSKRSSRDGRPTSLGGSVRPPSVVMVAVDATLEPTLDALHYTLDNLVGPGDTLYLLGILHTTSNKYGNVKASKRHTAFEKGIAADQEVQKLFNLKKIIPGVRIAVGSDRKMEAAKQAVELRATWVILDTHLRKDKDYLMEHLNCNIVLMGKNKAARIIKIALPLTDYPRVLEWRAKWKAAVGMARGLRYLQEECQVGCMLHRDMRPNDIPLTDELIPQGEHFGHSRSQPNGDEAEETRVTGKFGYYLAPEYAESGSVAEKADVYSFGIVLLELVSGRKANDITRKTTETCLTEWARPLIQAGKTLEIVDPRLREFCDIDQVNKMVDVATRCISNNPAKRPEINEVLHILERKTSKVCSTSRCSSTRDLNNIPPNPNTKQYQINSIAQQGSLDSYQSNGNEGSSKVSSTSRCSSSRDLNNIPPNPNTKQYQINSIARQGSLDSYQSNGNEGCSTIGHVSQGNPRIVTSSRSFKEMLAYLRPLTTPSPSLSLATHGRGKSSSFPKPKRMLSYDDMVDHF